MIGSTHALLQAVALTLVAGASLVVTGVIVLLVLGGFAGASGVGAAYLVRRKRDRDQP